MSDADREINTLLHVFLPPNRLTEGEEDMLRRAIQNVLERERAAHAATQAALERAQGRPRGGEGGGMTKTYDPKCYDLAKAFLADQAGQSESATIELAKRIQHTIEEFMDEQAPLAAARAALLAIVGARV